MEIDSITQIQAEWRVAAAAGGSTASSHAALAFAGVVEAVSKLQQNLRTLSYPAVPGLIAVGSGLEARIGRLATAAQGTVPPLLRAFWSSVGGISLVDLNDYAHIEFWESHGIRGPQGFCDGVYVDACSHSWLDFAVEDLVDQAQDPDADLFVIPISPDGYHKDDISGGPAYGLAVDGDWLTPLQHFDWTGPLRPRSAPDEPCDLLSYLRSSILECAGFPALYGVEAFEPIRRRLLENVRVF